MMRGPFIHCVLLCGFFVLYSLAATVSTTPYFSEVFTGKCFEKNPTGVDCYSLYGNFSNAAMTDNAIVTDALWDPFFAIANFSTAANSIMFWSGSMAFAMAITTNDPRFVTIEETSTGYVMNDMNWCGTPNHTFDYINPCGYLIVRYYGTQNVWTRASKIFAEDAKGGVYVLLQPASIGGSPPVYQAYRNTSIFATTELPSMKTNLVKNITILLLRNTTQAPHELCGSGSLAELSKVIEAKFNFTPMCLDDPTKIYDLLCPAHTSSAQCLAATLVYKEEVAKKASDSHLVWAIITTISSGILFILVIVLLIRMNTNNSYEPVKPRK